MAFEIEFPLEEDTLEFLSTLSTKVRVLTMQQISRTWPAVFPKLKRMEKEGLLHSYTTVIHPELPLVHPVVRWHLGRDTPNFASAAFLLQRRWREPPVPMKCFIASSPTGRMFGGNGGRYPRESEETHDIHLSRVYLRLLATTPQLAASWVSEAQIKSERKVRRGRVPDALISKRLVIEFGGAYKKAKLLAFHKYCEAHGFDYEVW